MFSATRKKIFFALPAVFLLLQGCGVLFFTDEDFARNRRENDTAQFSPYRHSNTVEAYREFIAKYPKNMYLESALDQIDNLEFAPYEKTDTIEAYTQFVARYPGNRHAVTARGRIDQATIKDCERLDTIEAYRQFLEKHSGNIFAQTAQDRLQDLEFRELAQKLQQQYGFDLLLYRLHVKRLQPELPTIAGISLGDFTLFVSLEPVQGKQYLKSHLIYSADLAAFARAPAAQQEQIFDALISPLIGCLARQFPSPRGIEGFSFALARSGQRFYGNEKTALEYAFPAREALLFAQKKCDRSRLFAQAAIRQTLTAEEKPQAGRAAVKLEGGAVMEKSAALRRANDFTMSATWKRVSTDGTVHEMKTVGKWKDFKGAGGYSAKSVINYVYSQRSLYAETILTATDTGGNRQYWYIFSKGDAGRTPDIDNYRPPAERDFPLAEFAETPVDKERHQYAGAAPCGSGQCYVVHSTPEPGIAPFGKTTSFIDQQTLLPVKIEYYDTSGALWKTAHLTWQETGGVWFWQRAVIENAPSGAVTTIVVTEVKANTGLAYSEFTPGVLMRH